MTNFFSMQCVTDSLPTSESWRAVRRRIWRTLPGPFRSLPFSLAGRVAAEMKPGDRSLYEMAVLSKALDHAVRERLNIKNSAAFDLLLRRWEPHDVAR